MPENEALILIRLTNDGEYTQSKGEYFNTSPSDRISAIKCILAQLIDEGMPKPLIVTLLSDYLF